MKKTIKTKWIILMLAIFLSAAAVDNRAEFSANSNELFFLNSNSLLTFSPFEPFFNSTQDQTAVCWFDANGRSTGMDACFTGNSLSNFCKSESGAACQAEKSGVCNGTGNYAKYLVLKPSDGFNCPVSFGQTPITPPVSTQSKVPVSAELSLQSAIQKGANGRNRIPINRDDPAHTVEGLMMSPAIYLDVTFADGTKMGPHDYKRQHASNLIFDDKTGDPGDLIEVSFWNLDYDKPQLGKYAAQLATTGKGVGTAYLKVSFRDAPNVSASVMVEVVSGKQQNSKGSLSSLLSYRSSIAMTNEAFLERWENDLRSQIPLNSGEYEVYRGQGPSSLENYFYFSVRTPNVNPQGEIRNQANLLKSKMVADYCKSEAYERNITVVLGFTDMSGNSFAGHLAPYDCKGTSVQGKTVFITSQDYDGNLGGVSGANAKCQMHAKNAGLSGMYKAWIADDYSSPWTSFSKSTVPYVMTNGTQVAANWQSLISSNLDAKLDINEFGSSHPAGSAWTGTDEGRKIKNCNGWTSNQSTVLGTEGCSSTTDSRWGRTNCGENWCHYKYRLYCFEQ